MIPFPNKKYDIIYADPPWQLRIDKKGGLRKLHYPRMTLKEICDLDIGSICNSNVRLYLWTTAPQLYDSMKVIDAWGFTYKSNMVWDEELIGLGYWFRNQHEQLLVATKGKARPPHNSIRFSSVFKCKRGRHSKKPDEIRDRISRMFPDESKIELFARERFEGWDAWGNEV